LLLTPHRCRELKPPSPVSDPPDLSPQCIQSSKQIFRHIWGITEEDSQEYSQGNQNHTTSSRKV
jgi:hypothetical protein